MNSRRPLGALVFLLGASAGTFAGEHRSWAFPGGLAAIEPIDGRLSRSEAFPLGPSDPSRLAGRLPARADGELVVAVDGLAGGWIRERLVGASASARADVAAGRVAYADALSGVDRIFEVSGRRVEEYLHIADAASASLIAYQIETGPVVADLVHDASGAGLLALDAAGRVVLKVPAPTGVDAARAPVQGRLEVSRTGEHRYSVRLRFVGDLGTLRFPVLLDPSWVSANSMSVARYGHTATLLPNGRVLLAGGIGVAPLGSTELYDPLVDAWIASSSMLNVRVGHTATLLTDGRVLVAGGKGNDVLAAAEMYDPMTGTWAPTGAMVSPRESHTANLLPSGKVLVSGGRRGSNAVAGAEIFDPVRGTWTATASLAKARFGHTATVLPDGKVLVVGGAVLANDWLDPMAEVELYDPSSGRWSAAARMTELRAFHVATLMSDGKVLVAGGRGASGALSDVEIYDPATDRWTTAEPMTVARESPTATLLPDGSVLVATGGPAADAAQSADVYDPETGMWSPTCTLMAARQENTATLLPNGKLLLAGGRNDGALADSEVFDPFEAVWEVTGGLTRPRSDHTATLLPDGKLLVVGGRNLSDALADTELYDPTSGKWTAAGALVSKRESHTATLLGDGQVLVAGGGYRDASLASAELFDSARGSWISMASMTSSRSRHAAALLPNGKVLVVGGNSFERGRDGGIETTVLSRAEAYDPATRSWTATGSLSVPRSEHTATLLSTGEVLVAGGAGLGGVLAAAELYNPATGAWSATGALALGRAGHTATLLPSGKVLVVGGMDDRGAAIRATEIYDPAIRTWSAAAALATGRYRHTATLLPDGNVVVAGGTDGTNMIATMETYDPVSGLWEVSGSLAGPVAYHTAALLADGRVLFAGGGNHVDTVSEVVQTYDEGRGVKPDWRPVLNGPLASVTTSGSLRVSGGLFTGIAEGSGGDTQSSPANHPVLILRRLDNQAVAYGSSTTWSADSATFRLPSWLHQGQYLVWVAVAGALSNGQVLATDLCNTVERCGSDCLPCQGTSTKDNRCGGNGEPAAEACRISCQTGFADRDDDHSNGCETVLATPDAAVALPDGGATGMDAGTQSRDAGPDLSPPALLDAAAVRDATLADVAPAIIARLGRRGGCSCSVDSEPAGISSLLLLLVLAAFQADRIRRRSRCR